MASVTGLLSILYLLTFRGENPLDELKICNKLGVAYTTGKISQIQGTAKNQTVILKELQKEFLSDYREFGKISSDVLSEHSRLEDVRNVDSVLRILNKSLKMKLDKVNTGIDSLVKKQSLTNDNALISTLDAIRKELINQANEIREKFAPVFVDYLISANSLKRVQADLCISASRLFDSLSDKKATEKTIQAIKKDCDEAVKVYGNNTSAFQKGSNYVEKYEENVKKMEDILTKTRELVQNFVKTQDHIFEILKIKLEEKIASAMKIHQLQKQWQDKMSSKTAYLKQQIEDIQIKAQDKINSMKNDHEKKISAAQTKAQEAMESIKKNGEKELQTVKDNCEVDKNKLKEKMEGAKDQLRCIKRKVRDVYDKINNHADLENNSKN